ncbi:MAG TPA: Gfo/Idh/MocA family oxidoreductase [Pirellulales bacterium]|nr:Gfo/Idh/MocA family oxidoreductase [Pirellulales bacterium]
MNRRDFLVRSAATGVAATLAARSICAASDERKLRVGVIGHTGRGDYGHGLNTMWLNLPETEIVAVADPDAQGRAACLRKLGVSRGFDDYRQMLVEMKPDLVAIGMRHVDQHRDVALAAVEAGARGIYLEKPFCRTPAEADEIVAACERSHTKVAVAHRNRYHPALPVIARLLQDGAIGKVLELRGRGKEDARGGALDLYVLGSHVLDQMHYFGGKPVACSATVLVDGRPIERADVQEGAEGIGPLAGNEVHARYELERGIPAFFDSIHDAGTKQAGFGLQIIGTEGIIDLRMDQEPLAHLLAGSPFRPSGKPRSWVPISSAGIDQPEPDSALGQELSAHTVSGRDLIAAVREDRQPLCNMYEGRTVIEMISAVFESQRLGGQRVTFPLATRENPLTKLA